MAVNKVVLGDRTLIDLSYDTATEEDVLKGKYFHRADGEMVEGSREDSGGSGGGGGEGVLVEKEVNFYDYDGTLLYSYDFAGVQAMNELPEAPTHEGLTFTGWNWTLEQIKRQDGEVDVGAVYITDDGKTRLYISIETPMQKNVTIQLSKTPSSTDKPWVINWGDGTGDEEVMAPSDSYTNPTAKYTHAYEELGEYVITLAPYLLSISNSAEMSLGHKSYNIFGNSGNGMLNGILRKVELGKKVTLNPCCFYYCRKLQTVVVGNEAYTTNPDNSTAYPFGYCQSLKSIVISTEMGSHSLEKYTFFNDNGLETISLPPTGSLFGDYAFNGCTSLRKLTIPYHSTNFNRYCLYNTGIKKLTLPSKARYVDSYAFDNNNQLEDFIIKEGATAGSTWNCCAKNAYKLKSFTVPNGVTALNSNAFENCYNLESVHLPEGLTSIGSSAFVNCESLHAIDIPESVTTINSKAFQYCRTLYSLNIPSGVTTISAQTFEYCQGLAYVDFSKHTAVPTLSNTNAFSYVYSGLQIRVPAALYDEWIAATNWSSYKSKIVAV